MELKIEKTARGFAVVSFKDKYNTECSLQKSSAADAHCIWFGVDEPPEPKAARMHLDQQQVKALLPFLLVFAATGEVDDKLPVDKTAEDVVNAAVADPEPPVNLASDVRLAEKGDEFHVLYRQLADRINELKPKSEMCFNVLMYLAGHIAIKNNPEKYDYKAVRVFRQILEFLRKHKDKIAQMAAH